MLRHPQIRTFSRAILLFLVLLFFAPRIFAEESAEKGGKDLEERLRLLDPALATQKPADLRGFAARLFEEEDYYNALTIYKYLAYKAKPGEDVEALRFQIALCYEMGEQWEEAEKAFEDFITRYPQSKRAPEASYRIGQGYFRGGKFVQASNKFHETIKQYPDSDYAVEARYALGLAHVRLGNWQLSQEELKKLLAENPTHRLAPAATEVERLLGEGERIPKKSPTLAGVLSIIPGLGKVYTHHYGGAIIALLVNGGLGYVVYDSFEHERYAVAGIFSALTAATYSANIVGGYRSAIRYNTLQQDKFADLILSKGIVPDLGLTR